MVGKLPPRSSKEYRAFVDGYFENDEPFASRHHPLPEHLTQAAASKKKPSPLVPQKESPDAALSDQDLQTLFVAVYEQLREKLNSPVMREREGAVAMRGKLDEINGELARRGIAVSHADKILFERAKSNSSNKASDLPS